MQKLSRKQKKAIDDAAYRVASRATMNNPVSVLELGRVAGVARLALTNGATAEEAEAKTRDFIATLKKP